MSFDIEQVITEMTNAVGATVKKGTSDIRNAVREILENEKQSLRELGEARARDDIDDAVFQRELEREKKVVEAELLAIEIMTKAMAQKAVNAAMDVFANAVRTALAPIV